jgi:hypothetical protein
MEQEREDYAEPGDKPRSFPFRHEDVVIAVLVCLVLFFVAYMVMFPKVRG